MNLVAQLGKGIDRYNGDTWMLGERETWRVVISGGVELLTPTSQSKKGIPNARQDS